MQQLALVYRQMHDFEKPDRRFKLAPGHFFQADPRVLVEVCAERTSWGFLPQVKIWVDGDLKSWRPLKEGEVLDLSEYGSNWICVPRAVVAKDADAQPDYFLLDMHQIFSAIGTGVGA